MSERKRQSIPSASIAPAAPAPPGRSTTTSRMPPSAHAIARALAAELRGAVPAAPVQASGDLDGDDVHAHAAHGVSGGGGALPFLDDIQRAFGHHDVSGVRAHVGGAAADASAAIGARAYATGDDVAFAQGPDLHTVAHEAAHVVQQRGGVRLSGGVGRSGDDYERHADAVADLVVRGDSVEALLDPFSHRGAAGGPAVQRDPTPGMRALHDLLQRNPHPSAQDVIALMTTFPNDAHAIARAARAHVSPAAAAQI